MKTNAIVRIIVFSLALLILLGILAAVLCFNMFIIDGKVQFDKDELVEAPIGMISQSIVTDEVRRIEIDWAVGSITIQPDSSATEITICEYANSACKYQMVCKQSGQTLKIQYGKDTVEFPSFGINADFSKELVITVPADWVCDSLEIDTASARVDVDGITIEEFDFDGASGVCSIINCNVNRMDIDTASGDVTFSGTLEILDCDAASADCSINVFNTPTSIEMDTASGEMELILPEEAGFTCSHETLSGRFKSDMETTYINGAYVHGDGSCKIKINAMSGDIYIYKGVSNHSSHHSE